MKVNFQETIEQKTDAELQTIAKDTVFYSAEERFLALSELEKRGALSEDLAAMKEKIFDLTEQIEMPQSVSTDRIYNKEMIWFAAFAGGPLAVGYLLAQNFKAFNESRRVKRTWIYTVLVCVFVFGGMIAMPENILDSIPKYTFPIVFVCIAGIIVDRFQKRKIDVHLVAGGRRFSWWRAIAISLIAVAVTLGAIIAIALLVVFIP